ncbi:MAG: hypothetical protein WCA97_08080 [Terriglobales bacterium]|jgi:hypothetical protein
MPIHRPTVLILARDPAFSREITAHWPPDHAPNSSTPQSRPDFIVLDEGLSRDLQGNHYDLAIADASSFEPEENRDNAYPGGKDRKEKREEDDIRHRNSTLNQSLAAAGKPAIIVHSEIHAGTEPPDFYRLRGAVLEMHRLPGLWPVLTGLIGREILRRVQAEYRARQAETICAAAQAEATLGRYMIEMRTNVNNALTSVLGNAELLVLEPGLPATVLAQADTIRNMALRLHEVFQRFSSIEKELSVDARESGKKTVHASVGR